MSYLDGLNEKQKEAVLKTDGPLLILAGAGSGKTKTITHRIVHLIHTGVAPENILAVTFTNKAAKEMRERAFDLIRKFPPAERAFLDTQPLITTFHSLGVRLLREFHEAAGLRRHFTIYDRSDSSKAIKSALESAGYNPKEFEPRRVLSMISRAKGDALSLTDFTDNASSYPEKVAAEVWRKYDERLREDHALDFDDLLLKTLRLLESNPNVRDILQDRFRYIHIDEYQDTNKVQYEIARILAGTTRNICVVGDIDQCLAAGTLVTMADGSKKPIEKIRTGEEVLSNYGSGDLRPALVDNVYKRAGYKSLVKICTNSGRTLMSTSEHIHFAGYRLGASPQLYFTYLMKKNGFGWRIGVTAMYTKGQKKPMPGFMLRCNQEHGNAVWVVATHQTPNEARALEYILSLKYQLPTIPFVARRGKGVNGYIHDQKVIDTIFASINTAEGAARLMKDYHLHPDWPHHCPQATRSSRHNINISLCGDRRGKSPMHRISMVGSNKNTALKLQAAGFSLRAAKSGSSAWRLETSLKSYQTVLEEVEKIKTVIPDAVVISNARLGKQKTEYVGKNSLPFMPAASIRPGMVMFGADGEYDQVSSVSRVDSPTKVYDLDISNTHNFIANDILTHNSIYSWRGADIKNVLQFEKHFQNAKTILLEQNYRSTKTIIEASNTVIEKNKNRVPKTVFTNNDDGEKITLFAGFSGSHEAEYVALAAKKIIEAGAAPSEIAVLFRTNFQSRALEEAFLNFDVPYQVLGLKFFERKEIKDALSYLRLALNPGSTADLSRVINTPTRGIGPATVLKVLEGKREELSPAAEKKVEIFDNIMMDIADTARTNKLSETIKFIVARTGIEMNLKKSGTEEDLERLENLRELVSLATRYDDLDPEEAVESLLEDAALQSDQDEIKDKSEKDAVRLMTVHAAKGLEFPYVFVTGLEEGLFPHQRLDEKGIDQEEERRLFYVALTRAGKKLWLTYAHSRVVYGSSGVNIPSSFLNDIDTELMEIEGAAKGRGQERRGGLLDDWDDEDVIHI